MGSGVKVGGRVGRGVAVIRVTRKTGVGVVVGGPDVGPVVGVAVGDTSASAETAVGLAGGSVVAVAACWLLIWLKKRIQATRGCRWQWLR